MPHKPPLRLRVGIALATILMALSGCGGGVDVTPQALRKAEGVWARANVRNYNLEWTNSGPSNAHYRVFVRGGRVASVHIVLPDGREIEAHSKRPDFFGVDGLFQVIEEELSQLKSAAPFGRPKGTEAILRFSPDPKFGYPRSYRRDVLGTPKALSVDVIRFDPNPPEAIPRPSP